MNKGSVSLTTVLVISSVLLLSGIVLVLNSIDLAFSTKDFESKSMMASIDRTCLEECLRELKTDPAFNGEVSYSGSDGSCVSVVTNDPLNTNFRIVNTSTTIDDYAQSTVTTIDISTNPYQVVR